MDSKRLADVTSEPKPGVAPVRTPAVAYPFLTRREIVARVDADPSFATECAFVLESRTQQRAAGGAPSGRAWGWMSSERVLAGRLVAKLREGALNEGDKGKLAGLVRRYSRQIADHCRWLALQENPELCAVAAKFGALPAGSDLTFHGQGQPEPTALAGPRQQEEDPRAEGAECEQDDGLPPRVIAHVELAPGRRTEEIAKALHVTTAMLAPALRMLVQGKKLKKHGVGRGTRYFAR